MYFFSPGMNASLNTCQFISHVDEYSDNFMRANSTGSGANWEAYNGGIEFNILNNTAVIPTGSSSPGQMYWVGGSPLSASQYAKMTIGAVLPGTKLYQISCRVSPGTGLKYYGYSVYMEMGPTTYLTLLVLYNNDAGTQLGTSYLGNWNAGDTVELDCLGSTITVFQNGVPIITAVDTTIPTGSLGAMIFGNPLSIVTYFEEGNLISD